MAHYDVFNGDADGLCALHQLRLSEPRESRLVTGTKREIGLLQRVGADASSVTVLDLSLAVNRPALEVLLARGVSVAYFDHHYAGDVPGNARLQARIDTRPEVGTAWLVDRHLQGRQRAWAVVGTFGDNLDATARALSSSLGLHEAAIERLRELGVLLNYNGYGRDLADLHFPPAELYRRMRPYADPFAFIADDAAFATLRAGYREDIALVQELRPEFCTGRHALYFLPDARWARRVSGVFANQLANGAPQRAHALLTCHAGGGYQVSVRAPLAAPDGADTLCRQFASGGGRCAAGGINQLPEAALASFVAAFRAAFPMRP